MNSLLANYNIKLIVKLHPAQSTPKGLQRHFSHLSVFSHVEFVNYGYDIYKLMAHADGLIGDYSSVSLQYLLLDRPEAFVVPDMDDYKKIVALLLNIQKIIWVGISLKHWMILNNS